MTDWLVLLLGALVAGAVVAWLVARAHYRAAALGEGQVLRDRLAASQAMVDELRRQVGRLEQESHATARSVGAEREGRARAEAGLEAARQSLDEQRALLELAQGRLADTFKALSAETLQESTQAFLGVARAQLDSELARREQALDALVRPLHDALGRYEGQLRELEASRQHAYGSLEQQLKSLVLHSAELQKETGSLATALRAPQVRGRWGELTLHRVVELAGLTEHCDYVEQATLGGGETGRLRPDMIVRLPGGRQIAVDAKAPLTAYLDAMSASTADERELALGRHAQQVRQHMGALAGKAYWESLDRSAELVVMFIPGEAFVGAAAQADPSLIEDGMARKVLIATPTTLVAVLRAVAYGWRQEQLAANAEHIRQQGQILYERVRAMIGHFDDMGDKLRQATSSYNKAVGSFEARVLPAARRFRDLGAGEGAEIVSLSPVDEQPRAVDAPEAPRQLEAPGIE